MAGKLSNRGGYRKNAGRKSSWKHPATKSIRVPPEIADQVIDIAKQVDNGCQISLIDSATESNEVDLEAIAQEILNDPVITRNGKDRGSVKRAVEAMVRRLDAQLKAEN